MEYILCITVYCDRNSLKEICRMLKLFRKNKAFRDAAALMSELPIDKNFAPQNIHLTVASCDLAAGDAVCIGDCVGNDRNMRKVYSGISGMVSEITELSDGSFEMTIENDFMRTVSADCVPFGKKNGIKVTDLTPEILNSVIYDAGISSRVRQLFSEEKTLSERINEAFGKAKQIVINCVGGEPLDSAVERVSVEQACDIINGMKILMSALKIGEGVIVFDSQNKAGAEAVSAHILEKDNIKAILADVPYPADNDHTILYALTSIELSRSKNALRVSCAVFDWRETVAIARAFLYGEKETGETVTVSGDIPDPMTTHIPYGTKFSEIFSYCGESLALETTVIVGGLLRGREVSEEDVFGSGLSPVILCGEENISSFDGERCVRCGECAHACPMMLMPMYLSFACSLNKASLAARFDIDSCIECGACQYVCPSEIPILGHIRKVKYGIEDEPDAPYGGEDDDE